MRFGCGGEGTVKDNIHTQGTADRSFIEAHQTPPQSCASSLLAQNFKPPKVHGNVRAGFLVELVGLWEVVPELGDDLDFAMASASERTVGWRVRGEEEEQGARE